MVFILGSIQVIARNEDGGWMQLLVFVVMAVIWAIGGILKAKKNKESMDQERQLSGKRPRPQPQRAAVDANKITQLSVLMQKPGRLIQNQKQAKLFDVVEQDQEVAESVRELSLKSKPLKTTFKRAQTEQIVEDLVKLEGPDDLRSAILHYEILGKPLSLRQ